MDEPLLGHNRRSFSFQHNLNRLIFQKNVAKVDPPTPAVDDVSPAPITPSEFKEKLVYGSLESPAGFYISRLFSAYNDEEQRETEEFLTKGVGRRAYDFHPVTDDNQQDMLYAHNQGMVDVEKGKVPEKLPSFRLLDKLPSFRIAERLPSFRSMERAPSFQDDALSFTSSSSESSLEKGESGEECLSKARVQKKCLKKSRTAPALHVNFSRKARDKKNKVKRPQLESPLSVVMQAGVGLLVYLTVGMAIYVWRIDDFSGTDTLPVIDALYFCIVTMCTIGYGDITPLSPPAKLFSCIFVLVGFGFIDILLSGMVAYVLERQEHLLLSAVEGSHHETAKNYLVNTEKGRMRIRMKVGLALGVVLFCLAIGTLFMHWTEDLGWLDSFYLSCMSVTTVGYGDHTFKTFNGRLFAAGWLLVSTLAVARSFLFLAEARIDKRNRLIAKWVLQREMTVGDLVAADIDNHGFVTKSEYVIYKLKEMGRIGEKEIQDCCRQFSTLDKDNSGRITISCLMNEGESSPSVQ